MRLILLPILVIVYLLAACGQSGDLYLPESPATTTTPAPQDH
ncbi:LPS translocon maturation chaperone LptM [Oceanococcus atlanticus]|nr:MAG: hypothetical protein EVA65_13820 [Oceanococcus sp.]